MFVAQNRESVAHTTAQVRAQPSSGISELKLHVARIIFLLIGPDQVKNTSVQKKIIKIKVPQGDQAERERPASFPSVANW
jgi:hypothetical protein